VSRDLTVTFWPSVVATAGVERKLSLARAEGLFTTPRIIPEPKKSAPRFSPTRCNGKRGASAVVAVTAIVFDHDEGPEPSIIAGALSSFAGWIYTSPGHRLGRPRCRSIVLTSREMTPAEFTRVRRYLAIGLESNGIAVEHGAAASPAHLWAVPAIGSVDADFESYALRGSPVDVDFALSVVPEPEPLPAPTWTGPIDANVFERARKYVAACPGAIQQSRGSDLTFFIAQKLVKGFVLSEDAALQILIDEHNAKCVPRWSLRELRHKVKSAAQRSKMAVGHMLTERRSP
jgi:hypothetical protein